MNNYRLISESKLWIRVLISSLIFISQTKMNRVLGMVSIKPYFKPRILHGSKIWVANLLLLMFSGYVHAQTCTAPTITATPTLCTGSPSNTYTLQGSVSFTNPPTTGTLTVSVQGGQSQVFTAPFTSPINYSISNLYADGTSRTVTTSFSAASCPSSKTYTAPASVGTGLASFPLNSAISSITYDGIPVYYEAYVTNLHYPVDSPGGQPKYPGLMDLDIQPQGLTNYTGYCVEKAQSIPSPSTNAFTVQPLEVITRGLAGVTSNQSINIPTGGIGRVRAGMVRYLIDNYLKGEYLSNPAWTNDNAAALAMALIEVTHEVYTSNNSFTLKTASTNGYYYVPTPAGTVSAAVDLGETYLQAINALNWTDEQWMSYQPTKYYVIALESSSYQDIIVPIPIVCTNVCVNPTPTVNSPTICSGQTATLTVSNCAGTVTWSGGLTGNPATTPALTSNTTYTATCTVGTCTGTATATVTVTPNPAPTVNSPTICSGQTATLTVANCTGTVTWSGGLTGNPATTPALTANTTYTATCTVGTCTGTATATVTVTPNPAPTVNSPTICSGQTATLTVSNCAGTVTWSGGLTGNPATTPALTANTTYTATCTVGTCTGTATSTVTVTPNPAPTVNSPTICSGQTATLTVSNCTGTVTWSGGLTGNPATTPALTANTTYTATCTVGTCTGTATSTVTVTPNPAPTVNSPTICSGQTATLTVSNCTGTVTWSGGLTGNPATTPALTANTTYTATCTVGTCTGTATATVTVTPNPAPTVNSPTICSGQTATLTVSNCAGTVTWSGGLTGNPATTPALTSNTTYTATCTVGTCTGTATATVTVTPNPAPTVNSPTICSGQTATLTVSNCTGTVTWSGGLTGNPATTPALTSNTTYTATCTVGTCTGTATATVTVSPNPAPTVNSPTICSGQTATLTVSNCAGTVTWSGGLTGNPATTPALTSNTTYTATCTVGTCTGTATATVTVTPNPAPTVNSPTICSGQTATLTVSNCTGTVTWSGGLTGNPATTPALTSNTTYTATCTVGTCTGTAVATVTVTPNPAPTVNSPTICSGQTATLTVSNCTGTVTWSGGLTGNPATTPALTSNTTYTATCTVGTCTGTATATVTVTPNPAPTVNSPTICSGQTATLTVSNCTGTVTWSGGLTGNPATTPALTSNTTYTATCTVGTCTGTATATVTVSPNLAPTVNSPTICSGQTATLTVSNCAGTVTWSGGLTGNPATTPALTSNTTYTATCTVGTCTGTATATVTVSPNPAPTVNSPTICSGQTATLTVSNCTGTVTWSGGLTGNPATTPALTSNTTYTATCTVGTCTGTATATVTVSPNPAPTVNSPTICSGQTATLTVSNCTGTVTWSGGLTGNPATTPALTANTTYTATCTVGTCTGTATATVTVTPNPAPTVNSPTICSGQTATLTVSNCTGTVTWSGGLTGNPATTPALTSNTTYTATCTVGTCTGTAVATVTVSPKPDAGIDQTLACANAITNTLTTSTTLVPNPAGGTYTQIGTTPAVATIAGNAVSNMSVAGTYQFQYSVAGCLDTVAVIVQPCTGCVKPNAGPDAPAVCEPTTTAKLTAVTTGGTWAPIISPANPSAASIDVNGNITGLSVAGTYQFVYSVTGGGMTCTDTAQVVVNAKPVIADGAATICAGETVDLTSKITDYSTLLSPVWTVATADGTAVTTPTAVKPTVTTTYVLVAQNAAGCKDTANVVVTVNPKPDAGVDQTLACANAITNTLTTSTTLVPNPAGGTYTQIGTTPAVATITGNDVTNMTVAGTYQFQYSVAGCLDTVAVIVQPCTGCVKPDAGPDAAAVCQPTTTAKLTAVTTGGTWAPIISPANPSAVSIDVNGNITGLSVAGIYQFVYSVTGGGITCTDTAQVVVNAKPVIADGAATICTGETTDLTAAITSYSTLLSPVWTVATADGTAVTTPTAVKPTVTTTYVLVAQNAAGCKDTANVVVTVNPKPNAGTDQTLACANAITNTLTTSTTLVPNPAGGTYTQIGTTPAVATITGNDVTGMTVAGTYQFVYTTAAGCKDTVAVTVSPCTGCVKPDAGLDAAAVCQPTATAKLTAVTTGGTWAPIISPANPSAASIDASMVTSQD